MENMENAAMMNKTCDKIKTYLDNMFASLPQTEQAARMKEDMYCSMLDKYNGYLSDGANEDEAFGRIVGEFGSVEDIRSELAQDFAPSVEAQSMEVQNTTASSVSPERKKQYDRFKIKQGIAVAGGVILCIMAVFGYPYFAYAYAETENAVFGILIALGVFLFVAAGTGEAKFYDITSPEVLKPGVSEERMNEYRKFLGIRQWLISLAVALFVVSPFVNGNNSIVTIPVLVALGVGILIIVGTVHDTYNDVRADK